MHSDDVVLIGLFCDIVGACLIWKYGLPEELYRSGNIPAIINRAGREHMDKITRYDRFAKIGLGLLLLGFVLQFLGVGMTRYAKSDTPEALETENERQAIKP